MCVNERFRSHGTEERGHFVAYELRPLLIVLESELEHFEHLWWKKSQNILKVYVIVSCQYWISIITEDGVNTYPVLQCVSYCLYTHC